MCITLYYKSDFGLMAEVPGLPEVTEGRRIPPRSPPAGHCSVLPGRKQYGNRIGNDGFERVVFITIICKLIDALRYGFRQRTGAKK